jgi:hypothetical protein
MSIDSLFLQTCQSVAKALTRKRKELPGKFLYCILCARAGRHYSYDIGGFSLREQKRPAKNGKKFSFWPKLCIKRKESIESQLILEGVK